MQLSIRQAMYLTAWAAVCISVFCTVKEEPVKYGASLVLCGLTLLQFPVHTMFGGLDISRKDVFEHFVCIGSVGVVGTSLIGVGCKRLLEYYAEKSVWDVLDYSTLIGFLVGLVSLVIFSLIHTLIYLRTTKTL